MNLSNKELINLFHKTDEVSFMKFLDKYELGEYDEISSATSISNELFLIPTETSNSLSNESCEGKDNNTETERNDQTMCDGFDSARS